jgi:hypothetical protein
MKLFGMLTSRNSCLQTIKKLVSEEFKNNFLKIELLCCSTDRTVVVDTGLLPLGLLKNSFGKLRNIYDKYFNMYRFTHYLFIRRNIS